MPIPTIQGQAGLVADPELRWTASNKAVLSLRLAFNDSKFNEQTRQWETPRTFFVDGTAWEQTAERLADLLRKGDQVYVEGRLETHSWEDKEGNKRSKPQLQLRTARKFERPPQQGFNGQSQPNVNQSPQQFAQGGQQQQQWGQPSQPQQADPWQGQPQQGQQQQAPF